jgi:hypothetical protein
MAGLLGTVEPILGVDGADGKPPILPSPADQETVFFWLGKAMSALGGRPIFKWR